MLNQKSILGSILALGAVITFVSFTSADDAKPARDGQHFRAKQILGSKVGLDGNSSIGVVDDIVLDDQGNVDYLIVLTADKHLVTVPWDAADLNVEKRYATVRITPEQFKLVPTYTTEQYPVFSTPAYRTQVYKYYGLTPAEQRRVIRRGGVVVPK